MHANHALPTLKLTTSEVTLVRSLRNGGHIAALWFHLRSTLHLPCQADTTPEFLAVCLPQRTHTTYAPKEGHPDGANKPLMGVHDQSVTKKTSLTGPVQLQSRLYEDQPLLPRV